MSRAGPCVHMGPVRHPDDQGEFEMMKKIKPPKAEMTYLPVTAKQFEDLTNEVLTRLNELNAPHFFSADYVSQVVMSAIHALDHKIGMISKRELLHACINRISCHLTYEAVEETRRRIKDSAGLSDDTDPGSVDGLAEINSAMQ